MSHQFHNSRHVLFFSASFPEGFKDGRKPALCVVCLCDVCDSHPRELVAVVEAES